MSIIYSDEELKQIEELLGKGFIELYEKLWAERNSVKNYLMITKRNFDSGRSALPPGSGGPHSKTYWEYKLGEIRAVLKNQNEWLGKVMEPLKGKISEDMYSRLEKYLEENEEVS